MTPGLPMEPTERFEIQLSHVCNNRCVFCVSGQMTELRMAKPTPLPDVKLKFDEAYTLPPVEYPIRSRYPRA